MLLSHHNLEYLRGMDGTGWKRNRQMELCASEDLFIGKIESEEEEESTGGDRQKYSVTEKCILRKEYFHAFPDEQTPASLGISG